MILGVREFVGKLILIHTKILGEKGDRLETRLIGEEIYTRDVSH